MYSWPGPKVLVAAILFVTLLPVLPVPGASPGALAQSDRPTVEQVRRLMAATDYHGQTRKMLPQIHDMVWGLLAGKVGGVSSELRDEISAAMRQGMMEMLPAFADMAIPIYQKHLTAAEVDALTKFYETPLGQSASRKFAAVTIEAMQKGALLGQQMGSRAYEIAVQRLRAKGYDL